MSRKGVAVDEAFRNCSGKTPLFTKPVPAPQLATPVRPDGYSYKRCSCDLAIRQKERDEEKTVQKKRRREERRLAMGDVSDGSGSDFNDMKGFPDYDRDNDDDA